MDGLYRATAALKSGEQIQAEGTMAECANWAENVIRCNEGEITIRITRVQ